MKARFTPLLLLTLTAVGCSGRPGEALIARLMNEQIKAELGEGAARFENVKKQNGYQKSDNEYVAEVEFDLVFLKSLDEVVKARMSEAPEGAFNRMAVGLQGMALSAAFGDFQAGDRKHLQRDITLIKTEKGWRLDKES